MNVFLIKLVVLQDIYGCIAIKYLFFVTLMCYEDGKSKTYFSTCEKLSCSVLPFCLNCFYISKPSVLITKECHGYAVAFVQTDIGDFVTERERAQT